jgi:hypothetical protein
MFCGRTEDCFDFFDFFVLVENVRPHDGLNQATSSRSATLLLTPRRVPRLGGPGLGSTSISSPECPERSRPFETSDGERCLLSCIPRGKVVILARFGTRLRVESLFFFPPREGGLAQIGGISRWGHGLTTILDPLTL